MLKKNKRFMKSSGYKRETIKVSKQVSCKHNLPGAMAL